MDSTVGELTGANYSQKIESIEITFSNNYWGDWYLGIGYAGSNWGWDWNNFTHMSPTGYGEPGRIGKTTFLLKQDEAANANVSYLVSFVPDENNRTVIPPNQEVRFVLYTYTQPTSTWGINSYFTAKIKYISDKPNTSSASASISLKSKTSTSITFEAHFENCQLGASNYPLCYYYSTSSNFPNSSYDGKTNNIINKWHRFSDISNDTVEYTITGLDANTTYFIWVAGAINSGVNAETSITIQIDDNKDYTISSYLQETVSSQSQTTARITEIKNTGATTCSLTYEFENNNDRDYSYYYYSSSDSYDAQAETSGSSQENKWCMLGSSASSTETNIKIEEEGYYYFWVATQIGVNSTAQNLIIINNSYYAVSEEVFFHKDTYSKCVAPTNVTATLDNGEITLTWKAGADGNYNPLTGYEIGYSTSANFPDQATLYTKGKNSLSEIFEDLEDYFENNVTYYFFVASVGTISGYNSGRVRSNGITIPASHPTIIQYSTITKTQMDALKAYKNNKPTAVTQYDKIFAETGNTYKANSVSKGANITADWYNKA